MYRIFLVEDDERLRELIAEYLVRYGFEVSSCEDFKHPEEQLEQVRPHLVLLDINLPYYDGFYLCRLFRRATNAPIIIISARSSELEQVMGIETGADDYLVKPLSRDLLLVKVKAALRRSYGEYAEKEAELLEADGIRLDETAFRLHYGKSSCELSKNEFKLIKLMLENKGKILSRERLLEELWDDAAFVDDNTLTVNVSRVKQLLADMGIKEAVRTKRGIGYIFDILPGGEQS